MHLTRSTLGPRSKGMSPGMRYLQRRLQPYENYGREVFAKYEFLIIEGEEHFEKAITKIITIPRD